MKRTPLIIVLLLSIGWAWRTVREAKQEWRDSINKPYCNAVLPSTERVYFDTWDKKWHVSLITPDWLTINGAIHAAHFSVWQHSFDDSCAAKRYAITGKTTYP